MTRFGSILGPFWVHTDYCLNIDASLGFRVQGTRIIIWTESASRQEHKFTHSKNLRAKRAKKSERTKRAFVADWVNAFGDTRVNAFGDTCTSAFGA